MLNTKKVWSVHPCLKETYLKYLESLRLLISLGHLQDIWLQWCLTLLYFRPSIRTTTLHQISPVFPAPFIYCPPDVIKDLPSLSPNISAPTVFIRIPQPKTNVNWYVQLIFPLLIGAWGFSNWIRRNLFSFNVTRKRSADALFIAVSYTHLTLPTTPYV